MGARPFLKTRFRAVPGRQDEGDHWIGGEPRERGATCPVCKIPLLLLWDINCRDRRFPRGKFGPLERLPLFFCWGCVSDLAYQVLPQRRINLLRTNVMREGPHFPYSPYPSHFERCPLALSTDVSVELRTTLAEWNPEKDWWGRRLTRRRKGILREYFGHPVTASMCLFHSQFGGVPTQRWWAEETAPCPNKQCPNYQPATPRGTRHRSMSFLAGVLNDPLGGLPMVERADQVTERGWNFFVSVQFQICGKCWTVRSCNRSD